MSLISDKDRYKKLSASDRARSRVQEDPNLPNKLIKVNQRERQSFTEEKKLKEIESLSNFNSVKSIHTTTSPMHIFTLLKGQTLEKFLIANGSSSVNFDLHWSYSEPNDVSLTTTDAALTESKQKTTRLYRRTLGGYESFGGANDTNATYKASSPFEIKDLFHNVDKNIYFYIITSSQLHITYLIT